MSSNTAAASQRHPRILACVLCQHRKIKCDRNSPCSNCIKANVTCVPSTPAPARKRRRPNQDLQERLARCEELLKQYAGGSSSNQREPAQTPVTPSANGYQSQSQSDVPTSTPASSDSQLSRKPGCVMVQEDGSIHFADSFIWASVYDELQKMRDIVETDDLEDCSVLGDELTPDNHSDIYLAGDVSAINLEELQPDPIHIFKLWQLYLDRIHPLTKVIHAPTLQPYIIEAATNMSSMTLNYQALLFSIFTMAAISMTPIECMQALGISQEAAIQRFNAGTKAALIKYNFLKNYNMTALQALLLYLLSLEGRFDRNAEWFLSGTILRIAQKMGYHRDGTHLNLTPFETEMRRRIWWQLLMLETKCAMLAGIHQSPTPRHWDTQSPSNVNDADLFPGSNEPVQERDGPTEMAFCIIVHEIFRFKLNNDGEPDATAFEAAVLGQTIEDDAGSPGGSETVFSRFRRNAQDLEERLQRLEQKLIDLSAGNVHIAALSIRHMLTHRLKDMLVPMEEQPEWGTEIFGPKDNFFKIIIMNLEHKSDCHERMASAGFQWFMKMHFQLEMFAVFTGLLHDRPMGSLSDRAWELTGKVYAHRPDLSDMTIKQHVNQAHFTLRAWKSREMALAQAGRPIEVPDFIHRLREMIPHHDSRPSTQSLTPTTSTTPQQPTAANLNQFVGGYLDVPAMNWEMFNYLAVNGNQPSPVMLDGYDLHQMNLGNMRQ